MPNRIHNKLSQVRMYQLRASMLERIAKDLCEDDECYMGYIHASGGEVIVNRAPSYIERMAKLTTLHEACMIWREMCWDCESCVRQLNQLFGWQIPEHVHGMAIVGILTREECNSFDT